MSVEIVFNALLCPYKPSGIALLLSDILILEERLKAPELQSEYFRMGIQHHRDTLTKMQDRYTEFQTEFNRYRVNELLSELVAQQGYLRDRAPGIRPLITRGLVESNCRSIIDRLEDMIWVNGIVDHLPDVDELMDMPDVLIQILEALQQ